MKHSSRLRKAIRYEPVTSYQRCLAAVFVLLPLVAGCAEETISSPDPPPTVTARPPHPPTCPDPHIARMGGADEAPVVLRRVEPEQDDLGGRSGFVVVEAIIDRTGRVCAATVVHSTMFEGNEVALAAVRQWEFTPAKLKGEPVQCAFNVGVNLGRK